jgi:hypothetical protein
LHCSPSALLLVRCSPRGTLYRKDRNKLVYPDPLPDLTHEFIEAAPGIKCARTAPAVAPHLSRPCPAGMPRPTACLDPQLPHLPPKLRRALPAGGAPEGRPASLLPAPPTAVLSLFVSPACRLHAVRTSKGSGKPLMLLVHGFPEAWFSWRHQMEAFRRGRWLQQAAFLAVCACVWCVLTMRFVARRSSAGLRRHSTRQGLRCCPAPPRCTLLPSHTPLPVPLLTSALRPPHLHFCLPCAGPDRADYEVVAVDMRGYGESSRPQVGCAAAARTPGAEPHPRFVLARRPLRLPSGPHPAPIAASKGALPAGRVCLGVQR